MRVLIVSKEVWRDDQNGGNTLSSIFSSFPSDTEFAQIFCSEGDPDNKICNKYFKLSTSVLVNAIRHGDIDDECVFTTNNSSTVEKLDTCDSSSDLILDQSNSFTITPDNTKSRLKDFFNKELFREIIWLSGKYKSDKLRKYITEFNPDIIFAPGYGFHYMNHLVQWIGSFMSCPIVSLISDDYYTYSIRSFNPFYWLNQPFLRHSVRNSAKFYDLVYTMADVQKRELEKDLNVRSKVLRKSATFDDFIDAKPLNSPIQLIYAGNLYANRWKTLKSLADEIETINNNKGFPVFLLDIYSGSEVNQKISNGLNRSDVCTLHTSISYDELMKLYRKYDIALHVEGFDIRSKAKLRMSFSTKIIDCLSSGCTLMCICEEKQGGHEYISKNDIGICVSHPSKIRETLLNIMNTPAIVEEYRLKAHNFGLKNHNREDINAETYRDFCSLILNN